MGFKRDVGGSRMTQRLRRRRSIWQDDSIAGKQDCMHACEAEHETESEVQREDAAKSVKAATCGVETGLKSGGGEATAYYWFLRACSTSELLGNGGSGLCETNYYQFVRTRLL